MNIPHPEQPHIAKLWIWARLLWCDPGQQRWPDPSNSRFFTTSPHLPTPVSWQRTFTARLPSSRGFYTENGTCTSTPAAPHLAACPGPVCQSSFTAFSCSILLQEHWRWQPQLLPLQHQHQHRPTPTPTAFSSQHVPPCCILGGAIVINLSSNSDLFDSYVCFPCCRWPAKGLLSLEHP